MLIETLVFCGQNGLFHDIRDLPDGDDGAPFLPEFPQEIAFCRDDAEGYFGLVVGQDLQGWKRRPQQSQDKGAQEGADHGQAERNGQQIDEPAL